MMNTRMLASVSIPTLIAYFDGKTAGWKMVKIKKDDGTEVETIEIKDGNPVWVGADGVEATLGGDTITRLNGEAKGHRERAEAAENKLKTFEGIDPVKAKEALEIADKIDKKTLLDAGEVDRVKKQIEDGFTEKLTTTEQRALAAEGRIRDLTLSQAFTTSQFVKDKIAIPVDMLQSTFGGRFKVNPEDGKIEVYEADGKTRLLSKSKQGEYADFEEGISLVVGGYSQKDAIMKGGNQSGGGNNGGGGNGKPGVQRYSRTEFEALDPVTKANVAKEAGPNGKFEIYDTATS